MDDWPVYAKLAFPAFLRLRPSSLHQQGHTLAGGRGHGAVFAANTLGGRRCWRFAVEHSSNSGDGFVYFHRALLVANQGVGEKGGASVGWQQRHDTTAERELPLPMFGAKWSFGLRSTRISWPYQLPALGNRDFESSLSQFRTDGLVLLQTRLN